jgi:plastocyanin
LYANWDGGGGTYDLTACPGTGPVLPHGNACGKVAQIVGVLPGAIQNLVTRKLAGLVFVRNAYGILRPAETVVLRPHHPSGSRLCQWSRRTRSGSVLRRMLVPVFLLLMSFLTPAGSLSSKVDDRSCEILRLIPRNDFEEVGDGLFGVKVPEPGATFLVAGKPLPATNRLPGCPSGYSCVSGRDLEGPHSYHWRLARRVRRVSFSTMLRGKRNQYRVEEKASSSNQTTSITNRSKFPVRLTFRKSDRPATWSVDAILDSILEETMTPREKAISIFTFLVEHRYSWYPADSRGDGPLDDAHDPVKFVNVYGFGFCDDAARNFASLARSAGLASRIWYLNGHVVAEAGWAGEWHMFDPDHEIYYMREDGEVASVEYLAANPQIIKAVDHDPAGAASDWIAEMYSTTSDNRVLEEQYPVSSPLAPLLAPGDRVTFQKNPDRRAFSVDCTRPPPPTYGTGVLERNDSFMRIPAQDSIEWPYLITGVEFELKPSRSARRYELSVELESEILTASLSVSPREKGKAVFDLNCRERPEYGFKYRIETLDGESAEGALAAIRIFFQHAPAAAPLLQRGSNSFEVNLDAQCSRCTPKVEIVHTHEQSGDCAPRFRPDAGNVVRLNGGHRFVPLNLTVATGTWVEWHFLEEGHSVRVGGLDDERSTAPFAARDVFARRFSEPGHYEYSCPLHPDAPSGSIDVFRAVRGDFNYDGSADILIWNPAQADVVSFRMQGGRIVGHDVLARNAVSREWELATFGDFDGDGRTDLVWLNVEKGTVSVWLDNGQKFSPLRLSPGDSILGAADVDGAQRDSLITFAPKTSRVRAIRLNRVPVTKRLFDLPAAGDVLAVADFDGDGLVEYLFRDGAGQLQMIDANGELTGVPETLTANLPEGWEIVSVGDYDGDGDIDLALRDGSGESFRVLLRDGSTYAATEAMTVDAWKDWVVID